MENLAELIKQLEDLLQTAREWGELTPSDKSGIAKEMEQDFLRKARDVERKINQIRRRIARARAIGKGVVRGGVYVALAYLLVAAIIDNRTKLPPQKGGSGACNIAAGIKDLHVDPSAIGPKSALKKAYAELDAQCAKAGLKCAGGNTNCEKCEPDVAVQTVDIKNRLFWYTADVTAKCQCWCKD
ncbi:MAG: hypothetical protein H6585_02255 [Flavobacteriales bacterium]|nr:hypothetical protein [Flavobacteriales bacterium]MCB9447150.1 hypothetical protein [Flavobacteriales bacterium]